MIKHIYDFSRLKFSIGPSVDVSVGSLHWTLVPLRPDFAPSEVSDKRKWPEAEVLALRWPANLDRMLGNNGRQAWIERAQQLPRTAPKKQSDGMCCGLPNLLEGTAENGPKAEKKAFTGCLTITKIKDPN